MKKKLITAISAVALAVIGLTMTVLPSGAQTEPPPIAAELLSLVANSPTMSD